jgi:hypothetical protein
MEELEASEGTDDSEELLTEDSEEVETLEASDEEEDEVTTDAACCVTVGTYPSGRSRSGGAVWRFHTKVMFRSG